MAMVRSHGKRIALLANVAALTIDSPGNGLPPIRRSQGRRIPQMKSEFISSKPGDGRKNSHARWDMVIANLSRLC
jgi:hypothetical protein